MNKFSLNSKTKNFIKNIFNKFGFQISRLPYKGGDPNEMMKIKIGKYQILLNGNHQLPDYMKNPYYSTNLPRLAMTVKEKYNNLMMIDVGANVGDTVAFVRNKSYFPIVCIEGDNDFFKILKTNLKNFKDTYAFQHILGEKNDKIKAELKKNEGSSETARIYNSNLPNTTKLLEVITLDSFMKINSNFNKSKLLKIDTDGYDLKIIRGGLEYIKKTKPILFFEYDTVFLDEQNDDGISTLKTLENLGYNDLVFYDNAGKFILSTKLSNHLLIKQIHNLIDKNYRTPFPFYDIVLFHAEDSDIAKKFIDDEMKLFYKK